MFVQRTGRTGLGCRPDGSTVMGYYDGNTVTALWQYAQYFAMSDNAFGTTFGPSTVGALNLVSGQTHGATIPSGVATSAISGAPSSPISIPISTIAARTREGPAAAATSRCPARMSAICSI